MGQIYKSAFDKKRNLETWTNLTDSIASMFQETLNKRLDQRVDSMVKDGLLDEIRSFYNENVKDRFVFKIQLTFYCLARFAREDSHSFRKIVGNF